MKVVKTLSLDELLVGMRVAEAVLDDGARVLVPAGAEVSEGMLAGLRRRDVAVVSVECEEEEDSVAREAHRGRVQAQLDQLFRKAGEDAGTRQLYQAVFDFRMEHRA